MVYKQQNSHHCYVWNTQLQLFFQYIKTTPVSFHLTVACIISIWLCDACNLYVPSLLCLALLLAAACAWLVAHYIRKLYILKPLSLALFIVSYSALRYQQQQQTHHAFYKLINKNPLSIIGTVSDITPMPQQYMRQRLTVNVSTVQLQNKTEWLPTQRVLHIYTHTIGKITVGDQIKIDNLICKKPTSKSFEQYLIKEGISCCCFANRLQYQILHHPTFSFQRYIHTHKNTLYNRLTSKLDTQSSLLFSSLFLGNKIDKKKLDKTADQFKTWGLSHYLARSGLHLVIVILLWHGLLRLIPLSFTLKQLLLLIMSIIYFMLSWPSISFARAFGTFVLHKVCALQKKRSHFVHLLSLFCFVTLMYNPMQLFFLDFQLSFALTFALAWFSQSTYTNRTHNKNR